MPTETSVVSVLSALYCGAAVPETLPFCEAAKFFVVAAEQLTSRNVLVRNAVASRPG